MGEFMRQYWIPAAKSSELKADGDVLIEASGNIERAAQLIKQAPPGFSIYSGDDPTAIALMLLGGHGNVSVTANVAPKLMHELCIAAVEGRLREATAIQMRLLPLHKQLFCEPSPAPTKWALSQLGKCGPTVRLPIVGKVGLEPLALGVRDLLGPDMPGQAGRIRQNQVIPQAAIVGDMDIGHQEVFMTDGRTPPALHRGPIDRDILA